MLTSAEKMEKMEYLKSGYKTHVLTNLYVKGFELNGIVYAYIDKGLTCMAIECETSKDGGLTVLKYKPKKKKKMALIKTGRCFKVCCSAYLEYHYMTYSVILCVRNWLDLPFELNYEKRLIVANSKDLLLLLLEY